MYRPWPGGKQETQALSPLEPMMDPAEPEGLIDKLDSLVEPCPEPENQVLADNARVVRWAGPLFGACSIVLVPWIAYIATTLPSRQLSPNYDIAWAGFDVLELCALAATAWFAFRRSRYLSTAAGAAAAMLVVDAWFDIMTTPPPQLYQSIAAAVLIELPLAAVCIWLSHHTHQLAERRVRLLLRRRPGPLRRRYGRPA
jgi:hypothetical protein